MKRKYTLLGAGLLLLVFFAWFNTSSTPAGLVLSLLMQAGKKVDTYVVYLVLGVSELLLIVPCLVYMAINGIRFRAMLGNRTNVVQNLLAVLFGVLMVPALSGLNTVVFEFFRLFGAQPMDTSYLEPRDLWQLLAGMVAVGAAAGVVEEPIFRGVVQRGLGGSLGRGAAIVVTALFFSFVHLDIVGALSRFLIGLALGFIVWRSGALLPAILAHAAFNSASLGLSLLLRNFPGWNGFFTGLPPALNGMATWVLISLPFIAASGAVYWLFARATPATAAWENKPRATGETKWTHLIPWALVGGALLALTALYALLMWVKMPDVSQYFQ